jgi:hypothetical protein
LIDYGNRICYFQKYIRKYRTEIIKPTNHNFEFKKYFSYWDIKDIKTNIGIFLGVRYIKNGYVEHNTDNQKVFYNTEIIKSALISPNKKENPIYVPIDAIYVPIDALKLNNLK